MVSGMCLYGTWTHRRQGFIVQSSTSFYFFNTNIHSWADFPHAFSPSSSLHSFFPSSHSYFFTFIHKYLLSSSMSQAQFWSLAMNKAD